MKKKALNFIFLSLLVLTFAACGNKNGENASDAEQSDTESSAEDSDEGIYISDIKEAWKTKPIKMENNEGDPDVYKFALAFCDEYSAYDPNAAMMDYIGNPKEYNEEEAGFHIEDDKSNGYISSSLMTEFDYKTDCCFWKRNDGHRLVAFWLCEQLEGMENPESLALFYDFDPKTNVMTPEPKLTELIEKNTASFPAYEVRLPDKDKDIEVVTFTDSGEDSYDTSSFQMIWDGQNFTIKK